MLQEPVNSNICDLCGQHTDELHPQHANHNAVMVCWSCLVASAPRHPVLSPQ